MVVVWCGVVDGRRASTNVDMVLCGVVDGRRASTNVDMVVVWCVVGNWEGEGRFKMWFNHGGAIEFGQAMLHAGQLGDY